MNLLHLRYFYEVGRTRNFTEASRNLKVSQPAISKMVRCLENELGHVLIERSRKVFRLTSQGEFVFQGAAQIFAEERQIQERLMAKEKSFSGSWSLGVSDNIAIHLMPRPLGEFKIRNPRLRISMFSGTSRQIKDEINQERCNLGIFYTPIRQSEPYESRLIYETEFWIVIARKNSFIQKKNPSLTDLRGKGVPRIESRHADYASGFPAHFHSRRLGLTEAPWLEVNQHEIMKKLVMEGFGYALLIRHAVEDEVASGNLVRVRCDLRLQAPVFAVWKRARPLDRISEVFIEHFVRSVPSL